MEKRRKLVFKKKDRILISKRRRRSSSESTKNLEQIPHDLIFEIFSKLPLKSITRFRCVSKHWNYIIQSSDFTNLFLKVSSSRPRLLFTVIVKEKRHFYSAPQPLNPGNKSSSITIDYHMSFPLAQCSANLHAPVNGLLCTESKFKFKHGYNDSKLMIFNPSTRQSIMLPIMNGAPRDDSITYQGYDPINNQYKVLYMSMRRNRVIEHEVLTVGIEKPAWRMIECSLPRHYPYSPLCINGVLYYLGIHGPHGEETMVVCFDVRSEKFKSIEASDKVMGHLSTLINYKGKLSLLRHDGLGFFSRETTTLELLVLDDVEKNEWSQHIFVLPYLWKKSVADIELDIVGMTGNGELVFSPVLYDHPLYIFFYNLEKNTIARVRIQGMKTIERQCIIQTFIDHVENVKLM